MPSSPPGALLFTNRPASHGFALRTSFTR
jgi:hypothetical protein